MVTILREGKGFPQRHFSDIGPSPYLSDIVPPELYENRSRSSVTLDAIRKDIFKFRNKSKRPDDSNLNLAISMTANAFKINNVKMLHLNDVFRKDLNIWSSSPGLPWTTYGYKKKAEVRDDENARNQIRWFWHRIKQGDKLHAPDSCAFVRSHIINPLYEEDKVRAVWGYPTTMTIGEAVFAIPLTDAYTQRIESPIAYGFETSKGGHKKIYTELQKYKYGLALDFKSFDKTVPKWLVNVAFDILALNVDFGNYQDYGVANASRMYRMWEYIKDYFINTPIRLCNGERYRKHAGVASGSYFTQLVDSVINHILITWMSLDQSGSRFPYVKVLGDDSICGTNEEFSFEKAAALVESIGMIINEKKSAFTTWKSSLTFLGFKLNNGLPTKETVDWFAALLLPERPDESWDDAASRALGLFYACSGLDWKFDLVCRYIIHLREFELKLSRSMVKMLSVMALELALINKDLPQPLDLALRSKFIF